jgi:hypothetical protein
LNEIKFTTEYKLKFDGKIAEMDKRVEEASDDFKRELKKAETF